MANQPMSRGIQMLGTCSCVIIFVLQTWTSLQMEPNTTIGWGKWKILSRPTTATPPDQPASRVTVPVGPRPATWKAPRPGFGNGRQIPPVAWSNRASMVKQGLKRLKTKNTKWFKYYKVRKKNSDYVVHSFLPDKNDPIVLEKTLFTSQWRLPWGPAMRDCPCGTTVSPYGATKFTKWSERFEKWSHGLPWKTIPQEKGS